MTSKQTKTAPRFAMVPADDGSGSQALNKPEAVKQMSERTKQFATLVTPEFHKWMQDESKRQGKPMNILLEDMQATYKKAHGLEE